tara:strand:+ start:159 stop:704 length:546 start_codon:yes stop_codon:yes gene_type:complete
MISVNTFKNTVFLVILAIFLIGCNGKLPGADARKYPDDPKKRVAKNLEEGRGFRLNETVKKGFGGGVGVFDFASSNELWRASLDTIDFMPLSSVNYSGGIIITDWYSDSSNSNESIKISIRFLTNEIRSDSLQIKVFKRECFDRLQNCITEEIDGVIIPELKRKILQTATLYKNEKKEKKE